MDHSYMGWTIERGPLRLVELTAEPVATRPIIQPDWLQRSP